MRQVCKDTKRRIMHPFCQVPKQKNSARNIEATAHSLYLVYYLRYLLPRNRQYIAY